MAPFTNEYDEKDMDGDIGDVANSDDDCIEIVELDASRYNTHVHVSKPYVESIIGKDGATKSRIENDTETELKPPAEGNGGNIVITGPSAANVKAAMRQINTIVVSSRMKQTPTHFISIPMNKPEIMENFSRFQANVLSDCQSEGLEESIFIKASKVHLTMGVMCLKDNEEKRLASKLLTGAKERVIMPLLQEHLPVKMKIKGLSYMNNNPKKINVLFANVEEIGSTTGIIQHLADGVVSYFHKKGFMKKEEFGRNSVKLHVTLLNTKYRRHSSKEAKASRWKRKTFDGSEILEKYGDFDFGIVEFKEIHLSSRNATGPDGYYEPTFVVSIP